MTKDYELGEKDWNDNYMDYQVQESQYPDYKAGEEEYLENYMTYQTQDSQI